MYKNRIRAPLRWKWRPRGPPGLSDVAYRSYTASRPTRELSAAHADASRGLSCAAHARGPHRVRGEQVRRSRSRDVSKITHGFCHNHFTPHTTSCDTMVGGTRCVGSCDNFAITPVPPNPSTRCPSPLRSPPGSPRRTHVRLAVLANRTAARAGGACCPSPSRASCGRRHRA